MKNQTLIAQIYGRVQGVFFRVNVKQQALKLNLTGFVKNNQNGAVSVVAEGKKQDLQKLLKYLHKGSSLAKVTKVDYKFTNNFKKHFSKFEILREKDMLKDQKQAIKNLFDNLLQKN